MRFRRGSAAVLIGLAVGLGSVPGQAGEALDQTKEFIERTRKAIMGTEVHTLALFSTVQNYQVDRRRTMRSMLITMKVNGDDALAYVCRNRPRFKEAVLRAVTSFYRASRGAAEISEHEVGRRTRALFAGYLKKDWLVTVDAHFVPSASDAGPEVLKTQALCKGA